MIMKDCCVNPDNLDVKQDRPDLLVKTCKVCNLRHFELTADPGKFGIVMKGLG